MSIEMKKVLESSFSKLNEIMIADALSRIERLYNDYCEYNANRERGPIDYYEMFNVCGGKGNYLEFSQSNLKHIKIDEEKDIRKRIEKRDNLIIKKLVDNGVTEIKDFEVSMDTDNGFTGLFEVAGHVIHIYIIYAGGYNVQKLHTRTIVNINNVKV